MGQDRTDWSAWEYADALNHASAAEVLELADEVNEKWNADGDSRVCVPWPRRVGTPKCEQRDRVPLLTDS